MKTFTAVSTSLLFSLSIFAQKSLDRRVDFLPDKKDSNNVCVLLNTSFLFPSGQTTSFQKSALFADHQKGNRVFQGEMEILFFPSTKYTNRFEPHAFFRVQAFPMYYLSSNFGVGISDRELSSSFGIFTGQYHRHVAYEGNFVTRRRKSFEYYPLYGLYLQSSSEDASFFISLSRERGRIFHSIRVAGRIGRSFSLGKEGGILNSIELVGVSESFTGNGLGISTIPVKSVDGLRLDVIYAVPLRGDQEEQAMLRNKLSSGPMLSIVYCIE